MSKLLKADEFGNETNNDNNARSDSPEESISSIVDNIDENQHQYSELDEILAVSKLKKMIFEYILISQEKSELPVDKQNKIIKFIYPVVEKMSDDEFNEMMSDDEFDDISSNNK